MLKTRLIAVTAAIGLISVMAGTATASPTVVYDNTTYDANGTFTLDDLPYGFWRFNRFAPYELMGDQITLAGTERYVTQFDIALSSRQAVTLDRLEFALWGFGPGADPNLSMPAYQIWSYTEANVRVDGHTIVSIPVPHVAVPDTFVWLAGADSDFAGLATFSPPTVGSTVSDPNFNGYWDLAYDFPDPNEPDWSKLWFLKNPVADFGARVFADAVPDPAVGLTLLSGWLVLAKKGRRRHPG
jgi:hypothetical protein